MHVLVAYDGSGPAQKALARAVDTFPDAEFTLLRVVEAAEGSIGASVGLLKESIEDALEASESAVSTDVVDVIDAEATDYRIEVVAGEPAREIVDFVEAEGIDHVFVGNHGREGVSRVLLGSVAERVVRRSPVPVTVVR